MATSPAPTPETHVEGGVTLLSLSKDCAERGRLWTAARNAQDAAECFRLAHVAQMRARPKRKA